MTSCEDPFASDSNEDTDEYVENDIVVSMRSSSVIDGKPGDIYQFDGDGWRVIVTDKTKIYVQRESCSGLETGSPLQVNLGYTILFRYLPDEVDYQGTPNVARALVIEAYRPECLP